MNWDNKFKFHYHHSQPDWTHIIIIIGDFIGGIIGIMVILGGFILMTLIGDHEFTIIIIHIPFIKIMDIELQEIMVIEVESIVELKVHLLDHKEPKLRQLDLKELKHHRLDLKENIDLRHLLLDHKVVGEEPHPEDEVNKLSHPLRWVFLLLSIYHYEIYYN
jgi:hypothetical protein